MLFVAPLAIAMAHTAGVGMPGIIAWPLAGVLTLAYGLSRSRYALTGGGIAVVALSGAVAAACVEADSNAVPGAQVAALSWLLVPMALAMLTFRVVPAALLALGQILVANVCVWAVVGAGFTDGLPVIGLLTGAGVALFALAQIVGSGSPGAEHEADADDAKSRFLASMSHELNTPLNAIVGMTSLLDETRLDGQQREYIETIQHSARSLLAKLADILELADLSDEDAEKESTPFSIYDLAHQCTDLVVEKAREKNLELVCGIEPRLPKHLIGDASRLRQILNRLLDNAIKFTEGGEVVLAIDGDLIDEVDRIWRLTFTVRDTGIGIAPDRQKDLFAPFAAGDSSSTRRHDGTGVGLTLAKRFAGLMDGTLAVESRLDHGSAFTLTITCEEAERDSLLTPRSWVHRVDMPILVVDDNATARGYLNTFLRDWLVRTIEAKSGEEALEHLHDGGLPALAIIDREMPGMGGVELILEIRRRYGPGLPIVLLSNASTDIGADIREQVVAVLPKPVRRADLERALLTATRRESDTDELPRGSQKKTAARARARSKKLGDKRPLRLLIAEDNPINLKVVVRSLARLGYTADTVRDGQSALDAATRAEFDLILMDLDMPVMDGLEATRRIRQKNPDWPRIVALTASTMPGERMRCMEAGMNGFLSKPLDVEELIKVLSKCHVRKQRDQN